MDTTNRVTLRRAQGSPAIVTKFAWARRRPNESYPNRYSYCFKIDAHLKNSHLIYQYHEKHDFI